MAVDAQPQSSQSAQSKPTTDHEVSQSIIDAQSQMKSSNGKASATVNHPTNCRIVSKTFYGVRKRQKCKPLRFDDYSQHSMLHVQLEQTSPVNLTEHVVLVSLQLRLFSLRKLHFS